MNAFQVKDDIEKDRIREAQEFLDPSTSLDPRIQTCLGMQELTKGR